MLKTECFLFEIGTEELPPKSMKKLAQSLESGLVSQLIAHKLVSAPVKSQVFATPRRLAVRVDQVVLKQANQLIGRRGPALKAAYDAQGQPTRAALGFARSVGLDIDEIQTQRTDKGEWLFSQTSQTGLSAMELLPVCVDGALKSLPIAKRMRWGSLDAEFIRPVHWVLLLLGNDVVNAQILSVKSDRLTYGHRFHSEAAIVINDPAEYESKLKNEGMVIADFQLRRQQISNGINELADAKQAKVLLDEALLDEVTAIVELPVPLMGNIDAQFMSLKKEILVCSMQGHQKYFPVINDAGELQPYFITVSNIRSFNEARIIEGNERVLRARLSDALFFWEKDQLISLAQRESSLEGVLFHKQLGSLGVKVRRLRKLAEYIAQKIGTDTASASRAAQLCKCDLVTDIVSEFPDLQGVMGKYYALKDGEPADIAQVIEEHYQPRFSGDKLPASLLAKAVAIADKLDTICGLFAVGEIPSGDKDSYGLRRAALGILRILIEADVELNMRQTIKIALSNFREPDLNLSCEHEIFTFIFERLKQYYQQAGFETCLYQAVAADTPVSPVDFNKRLLAVNEFNKSDAVQGLTQLSKRIGNILQKASFVPHSIDKNLFALEQEIVLFEQMESVASRVATLLEDKDYKAVLNATTELKQAVDNFFSKVMVMDEDQAIRSNRVALLSRINKLLASVADISYLR